jgi:hypothetical protein
MATVIDELVLRLGLDASQFTRGQDEFQRNLRKVQDETGTRGKEIEAAGNKMADAFRRVRNEVFALAASVFAIRGLREFAQEIIQNEAAIGRWAKVIGISTEDLSAWGGAAERAGGSMGATTGTLNGLMQQFQQFALTGQSQVVPYFRALGVQITDTEGKMRPMGDILLDLADKFHAMSPERAESFGTALGLDQGTINLLIQGRQAVEQLLEAQRRLGVVHKEDAEAGQALINNLLDLQQAVRDVGRAIITDLAPDIEHMLDGMRDWIVQNKEWVKTEIAEKIRAFSAYLQSIDWKAVGQGIHDFFSGINNVVTALGGWERVSEAIFALWVGSKFTGVIAAIALLGTRLLPITIAIAAIMAGWAAISAASENLNNPSGWSAQSPFWNGMSEEDQLKFTNSPASQKRAGTGGQSLVGQALDWATGGAPPAEGTPAGDVARQTHDFWRGRGGLTEEQTAGVLAGGVGPESGFNPNAVNPTSGAYGLYQYLGPRLTALRAQYGPNPTVEQQNEFALAEMAPGGTEAEAGRRLRSSRTAGESTAVMADQFERSGNPLAGLLRSRQAQAYVGRYDGSQPAGAGIARAPAAIPIPPLPPAAYNSSSNDNRNYSNNSSSSDTRVGQIVIQTQATTAEGIAKGIGPALERYSFALQSNSGLA